MCLIVVGWRVHADYPLVVAANRDEFYDRPTAPQADERRRYSSDRLSSSL